MAKTDSWVVGINQGTARLPRPPHHTRFSDHVCKLKPPITLISRLHFRVWMAFYPFWKGLKAQGVLWWVGTQLQASSDPTCPKQARAELWAQPCPPDNPPPPDAAILKFSPLAESI